MLMEWINEKPENEICLKFRHREGDIYAIVDIAEWIMPCNHQLASLLTSKE